MKHNFGKIKRILLLIFQRKKIHRIINHSFITLQLFIHKNVILILIFVSNQLKPKHIGKHHLKSEF